ncbi:MAG: DUF6554 family protein [Cyanobacteria bacterium J06638_7]
MVDQHALRLTRLHTCLHTWLLPVALLAAGWAPLGATAQQIPVTQAGMTTPGDKGAQIYCFMRDSGNSHEVSWDAAYEVIKRQGSGLFRPSPRHGAVMITEAVVQNPASYPNCGTYLGDLFPQQETEDGSPQTADGAMTRSERYGY